MSLQINRGRATANAQGGNITTVIHTFKDDANTVANIIMAFPDYLGQGAGQELIFPGDHILIKGSDTTSFNEIESVAPFTVGTDLFSGASGLSIGTPVVAVDANGAIITGQILQLEKADQTHPGILTQLAQDIGGTKTFHADVNIVDPPSGLNITKTTGGGGVNITTSDPTTPIGCVVLDTTNAAGTYGIIYKGNGFTDSNPQLWIIAGETGTSGIILDNIDESVAINNKLKVDIIDELGASNGTIINGVMLRASSVDTSTAIPLVLGSSTASEITLAKNTTVATQLTFTSGAGVLSNFATAAGVVTWTGCFSVGQAVAMSIEKINTTVYLSIKGTSLAASAAGVGTSGAGAVPVGFRPTATTYAYSRIFNNSIGAAGLIEILADGTINAYQDNAGTAFGAAGSNGIGNVSIFYDTV